ncbi:CHAT domain-containing protein [Streptomyces globisporus]
MTTGTDPLVEAATALLGDIEERDRAGAEGPEADRLVAELSVLLAPHDVPDAPGGEGGEDGRLLTARALLARILWHRSRMAHIRAVQHFAPLFFRPSHADAIPDELLQEVTELADCQALRALLEMQYAMSPLNLGEQPDRADFDELVERWRTIVAAPVGPRTIKARRVSNLADALETRFRAFQDTDDLDAAIEVGRRGIAYTGSDDKALAMRLQNVGGALFKRFHASCEPDDLDAAVSTLRAALDASTVEPQERCAVAMDLAIMLNSRFQATRNKDDLDESVNLARLAVDTTPEGDPLRALLLGNCGNLLRLRFDGFGAVEDLHEAIAAGRTAVDETDEEDPFLPMRLLGLSGSLYTRFGRHGAVADLDEAVVVARRGLDASDEHFWGYELLLSQLGLMLHARFTRFGATSDLEGAVDALTRAVSATPDDKPLHLGGNSSNLSIMLFALYEHTKTRAPIEEMPGDALEAEALARLDGAIEAARVAATAAGASDAAYLASLGNALRARYDESGAEADLEEATACLHRAVKITPDGHPDRPGHLSNLALIVQSRYEGLGEPTDLDEAIELVRAALERAPQDRPGRISYLTNLADLLRLRSERSGSAADAREAVGCYAQAVGTREAAPSARVTAGRAAAAHFGTAFPLDVARMLHTAVELLPRLAARHLERLDQQYALGGLAAGMASDAAALTLERTDLSARDRAERALRLLEAGRGVLLGQALDTRSDLTDLRRIRPDLAKRYVNLREVLDRPDFLGRPPAEEGDASAQTDLDGLEPPLGLEQKVVPYAPGPLDPQADRRAAAAAFDAVLEEIRDLPGLSGFARLPDLRELTAQAAAGPLIAVNVSRYRCDALLLTPDGVRAVPLPLLEYAALAERAEAFQQALTVLGDQGSGLAAREQAQGPLREVLAWLWDTVAEPVLDALGLVGPATPAVPGPRVWWMAGGLLSLLPLHAAGHHDVESEGRAVIDRVVSSYTPTIRTLAYARQQTAVGNAPRPERPVSSLIVSVPALGPDAGPPLPSALLEAAELAAKLPAAEVLLEPGTQVDGPDGGNTPTGPAVLERLVTCAIAHFACHGTHVPEDPSRSMLLLRDHATSPLNVAALMRVRLDRVQLAYLSACRTAYQGRQLLDESVHLASAFQLAGFPHVIAALWEVPDGTAHAVAGDFYDRLAEGRNDGVLDTDGAAHALHAVIRDIRRKRLDTPSLWSAYVHSGA